MTPTPQLKGITMIFTKRHYQVCAKTLSLAHPGQHLAKDNRAVIQWIATVKEFGKMLKKDNSKFDMIRFMEEINKRATEDE